MKSPKLTIKKFKKKNNTPRLRVECACGCKKCVDIYADENDGCEIGGVFASNEFWKKLFEKVLGQKNEHLIIKK